MDFRPPIICQNAECGLMFPGPIVLAPGATLNQNGEINATCPRCGSNASMPKGVYNNIEPLLISLLRSFDSSELIKLSQKLQREIDRNKSAKNIKKSLVKQYPEKGNLWSLIPKPSKEALITLKIILEVVTYAATISLAIDALTDDEIKENIINQSFEYHYHFDQNNSYPNDNQKEKNLLPRRQKSI